MTYNYEYFNRISITKPTQLTTGRMTKIDPAVDDKSIAGRSCSVNYQEI